MDRNKSGIAPASTADVSNRDTDSTLRQLKELISKSDAISAKEQRNRDRFPLWCSMQLTPLDWKGQLLGDDTIVIVGRDISSTGISFSHEQPLMNRHAVITLDHPKIGRLVIEVEILWSRQTPLGLYESGCRLVKKILS